MIVYCSFSATPHKYNHICAFYLLFPFKSIPPLHFHPGYISHSPSINGSGLITCLPDSIVASSKLPSFLSGSCKTLVFILLGLLKALQSAPPLLRKGFNSLMRQTKPSVNGTQSYPPSVISCLYHSPALSHTERSFQRMFPSFTLRRAVPQLFRFLLIDLNRVYGKSKAHVQSRRWLNVSADL